MISATVANLRAPAPISSIGIVGIAVKQR